LRIQGSAFGEKGGGTQTKDASKRRNGDIIAGEARGLLLLLEDLSTRNRKGGGTDRTTDTLPQDITFNVHRGDAERSPNLSTARKALGETLKNKKRGARGQFGRQGRPHTHRREKDRDGLGGGEEEHICKELGIPVKQEQTGGIGQFRLREAAEVRPQMTGTGENKWRGRTRGDSAQRGIRGHTREGELRERRVQR